jgi:surface polysaccharide O-acyltransferase-like enzyme
MTLNPQTAPAVRSPRKSGLDAFRLLCMLGVIGAHAELYEGPVHWTAAILTKWSVPFFFLVLGYFLGKKDSSTRTHPALERAFLMIVVASVLLLPLEIAKTGLYETWHYVVRHFYFTGAYFHLWYLNSLLMGLVAVRIMDIPALRPLRPWVAVFSLIAAIVFSSYLTDGTRIIGRQIMSLPFLYLGMLLSRRVPSMRDSIALVLLGIGIEILESWLLKGWLGRDFWTCPLSVGTVVYAVGMFGIAFNLPSSPLLTRLGRLGGRFGGCIYVTHPYALECVFALESLLPVPLPAGVRLLLIPATLLLNLAVLRAVDSLCPAFIDMLLGSRSALSRLSQAVLSYPLAAVRAVRAFPSRL